MFPPSSSINPAGIVNVGYLAIVVDVVPTKSLVANFISSLIFTNWVLFFFFAKASTSTLNESPALVHSGKFILLKATEVKYVDWPVRFTVNVLVDPSHTLDEKLNWLISIAWPLTKVEVKESNKIAK